MRFTQNLNEITDYESYLESKTTQLNQELDLSLILSTLESYIALDFPNGRFKHCSCSISTDHSGFYHISCRFQLYDEQSNKWLIVENKISKDLLMFVSRRELSQEVAKNIYYLFRKESLVLVPELPSWTELSLD